MCAICVFDKAAKTGDYYSKVHYVGARADELGPILYVTVTFRRLKFFTSSTAVFPTSSGETLPVVAVGISNLGF